MNRYLFKTNLFIALILLIGFTLAAWLGNRAYYHTGIKNLELVTSLTADSIYYQFARILDRPVNVARTMAHDTFLIQLLEQEGSLPDNPEFVTRITDYLKAYHKEYELDSVFLVPTANENYYTFHGLERPLVTNNEEDAWYYNFVNSEKQVEVNIHNTVIHGSHEEITVFINCRINNQSGRTIGVVGVGIRTSYLKNLIANYEKIYNVDIFFIDKTGKIEISNSLDGNQDKNLLKLFSMENLHGRLLDINNSGEDLGHWVEDAPNGGGSWYFVARYIHSLSWYLVIGHDTSQLISNIKSHLVESGLIVASIVTIVIFTIIFIVKRFNKNIAAIIEQRHKLFKKATEKLYDNIFEWNINENTFVDKNTGEYVKQFGVNNPTYDESILHIANKQILSEFSDAYLATFNRENIVKKFNEGIDHLQFDFKSTNDGVEYHWLRIDAHIFFSPDDHTLHMFTYRKNIDAEKYKEFLANIDEMTQCYTKKATERIIEETLGHAGDNKYAFMIIDIDNFKHANDRFGHAFGDLCIKRFAAIVKSNFREEDIVGRLGGDEFAVFMPITDISWLKERTHMLSKALNFICADGESRWEVSASIGVSVYPENGTSFAELYRSADGALYHTKQAGKNAYTFVKSATCPSDATPPR